MSVCFERRQSDGFSLAVITSEGDFTLAPLAFYSNTHKG